jgi:hypothetical protein
MHWLTPGKRTKLDSHALPGLLPRQFSDVTVQLTCFNKVAEVITTAKIKEE